jgi:hypothetical protein
MAEVVRDLGAGTRVRKLRDLHNLRPAGRGGAEVVRIADIARGADAPRPD